MRNYSAQITFLSVSSLERAGEFYAGVLGLRLVLDQGHCRIFQAAGDAYLGVCDTRPTDPGNVIVTLVTDDVDDTHQRLLNAGAPIDVPPRHNPDFGIYQLMTRDPDGHVVEVQRFDDPAWAG